MTDRFRRANSSDHKLAADHVDGRDQEAMQALVAAGACVALADGHLENACVVSPARDSAPNSKSSAAPGFPYPTYDPELARGRLFPPGAGRTHCHRQRFFSEGKERHVMDDERRAEARPTPNLAVRAV